MTGTRMDEVVNEILRLSRAGKLKWEKSIRKNEYRVAFPDMSFIIKQTESGGYQLDLIGDTGQVISSLDSNPDDVLAERLGDLAPKAGDFSSQHKELEAIYLTAESYVREVGITKALEVLRKT